MLATVEDVAEQSMGRTLHSPVQSSAVKHNLQGLARLHANMEKRLQ